MELLLIVAYIAALGVGFGRVRRVLRDPLSYSNGTLVLLVALGVLLIDRVVIAIGGFLGEGDLLAALNLGRLWLAALTTPLLIVTYIEYTGRLRIKSALTPTVAGVAWGLAWACLGLQAWESLPHLQFDRLVAVEAGWMVYYVPETVPVYAGTLAVNTAGVIFGIFTMLRTGWPVGLLGIGLVWAEALFFPQAFVVQAGFEVAWLWSLILTEWRAGREGLQIKRGELDNRLERL